MPPDSNLILDAHVSSAFVKLFVHLEKHESDWQKTKQPQDISKTNCCGCGVSRDQMIAAIIGRVMTEFMNHEPPRQSPARVY